MYAARIAARATLPQDLIAARIGQCHARVAQNARGGLAVQTMTSMRNPG